MMDLKYETTVHNNWGAPKAAGAETGFEVKVGSVSKADFETTNPEQLIGMSWATCLNATIRSILKAKQMENHSIVNVHVKLWFDEKTRFQFTLDGEASIEGLTIEETEKIVAAAHRFCPVSKLIGDKPGVTLKSVLYAK